MAMEWARDENKREVRGGAAAAAAAAAFLIFSTNTENR